MNAFLRQLRPAFLAVVAFTLICGLADPLVVTALAQLGWKDTTNGSLIERGRGRRRVRADRSAVHLAGVLPPPAVGGR